MESPSLARIAAALSLALTVVACGPSAEEDRTKAGPVVGPFLVSDFFTPSGLMGDGAVPEQLKVDINRNCKMPRPPGAQGDCYRWRYNIGKVRWAGAYWVFPANNWGTSPGRDLIGPVNLGPDPANPTAGDLHGYNYVRFYAAIDVIMPPGVPVNPPAVQYWAGRLDGRKATPAQPYFDVGCSVFPGFPPMCKDETVMPPVATAFAPTEDSARFTPEWKQYKIDLSRWSVESVIGGFGFSTNDTDNPGRTQIIYFDDIVWE